MFAVVSLVGAVLFSGQSSRLPSPDVLVITGNTYDANMLNAVCKKPVADGVAEFQKAGFEEVTDKKSGLRILFAPEIWQSANMKRQLALYKELGDAIKPDGTVDLSQNSELLSVCQSMFSSYGVDASATVGVDAGRQYQLQVGEKQMWLHTGMSPNMDRLKDHPVNQPDKMPGDNFALMQKYQVRWPGNYLVCGFGKYIYPSAVTNGALEHALPLITAHIGEYFVLRQNAYQQMLSKVVQSAKGDWGKSFNDLPSDAKSKILGEISSNFGQYGFPTSGDAEQWAQNAVLSSTNTSLYISIYVKGQGGVCFEVP